SGGPRVRLDTTPAGRVIDTGPLRLTIPASGASLASAVEIAGRRAGQIPLPTLGLADGPSQERKAGSVGVETEGPVRTELVCRGGWRNGATYEARLAAFAGQPALRLRYTLTHGGEAPYLSLSRLTIAVPGDFRAASLGIGGAVRRSAPLVASHALRQVD